MIPPVFVHLYRLLPFIVVPPLAAYAILKVWVYVGYDIAFGLRLLAYLFSYPLSFYGQFAWNNISNRKAAAKMGAIFAPHVKLSPWAIYRLRYSRKTPYIGEPLIQWAKEYGNTYAFTITQYRIVTLEPVQIKAILATQFEDFEKGPEILDRYESLLGDGIFNTDGDAWKFHRSTARPFFNKDRISDFAMFEKHADQAITHIAERLSEGQPVEFADVAARFTLDTATEFLFGKSVESMDAGLEYPASSGIPNPPSFVNHPSNAFVKAFAVGQHTLNGRNRLGTSWRLQEPWTDAVQPYRNEVNKFIDPIIKEALAAKSDGDQEHETLLSSLITQTQDYKIIQDQLINILVAGRDTTANTLMFAIYMLIQHPDIVRRLREEIMAYVGQTRAPTYQDFRDMKYLRAFLNETLRLYPIVPSNGRASKRATTLPSATPGGQPIYVPQNTTCLYSVFWMHRRTDLWGPDAEEFDPDRFIDERLNKYLTPNPYIFLPFNGGPRICLGQQFAYNEMSFFLVRLLQRFSGFSMALDAHPKSSLAPEGWSGSLGTKGTEKIWVDQSLTMFARGGLWVRMEAAKSVEE